MGSDLVERAVLVRTIEAAPAAMHRDMLRAVCARLSGLNPDAITAAIGDAATRAMCNTQVVNGVKWACDKLLWDAFKDGLPTAEPERPYELRDAHDRLDRLGIPREQVLDGHNGTLTLSGRIDELTKRRAEPERADVATLERVLYAVRTVPALGCDGDDQWQAELRMRHACTQAVMAMLTEARAQPAAPSATAGEYEALLADAEDKAACRIDLDAIMMRKLAAALRKVLGELDADRKHVAILREERERALAEVERLTADLAREREAHEETRSQLDEAGKVLGEVIVLRSVDFAAGENASVTNHAATYAMHETILERDAARYGWDAASAEVERLSTTVLRVCQALGCVHEADGHIPDPADEETILRFIRQNVERGERAEAEVERLKAELDSTLERLRAQLEPVKVDAEALGRIVWRESAKAYGLPTHPYEYEVADACQAAGVAVAQAFARSLLTDGAVDVAHSVAWHADYRITTRQVRTVIEKALEHAGLHVEAEPVADESDAEVMLAAVREKMAPEHVAAFDAARAAAAADAERTRGVLTGALDKAKRLRVDPAKAATLPRASIGLPAPAAELVVEAAISRADVSERRAARMEAVKSQHERPDTTWHSFDEYVAGVRACPWEERRDNIAAAIRMVHKANEPHSSAIHAVTIALEQLAMAVDEVRRLGGGGR